MIPTILQNLVPNRPSEQIELCNRGFDRGSIWKVERNTIPAFEAIKHAFGKAFQLALVIREYVEHSCISLKSVRYVAFFRVVCDQPIERSKGNWILWIVQDVFQHLCMFWNAVKASKRFEEDLVCRFHIALTVPMRSS